MLLMGQPHRACPTPVDVEAIVLVKDEGEVVCSRNMQAVRPPEAATGQPQELARGGHAPHHEVVSLCSGFTGTLSTT